MRRSYPLLFAAFPVVGVAAQHPGKYGLKDVLIITGQLAAAVAVAGAVLYLVLRVPLRRGRPVVRYPADVAAALVGVAVVCWWGFVPTTNVLTNLTPAGSVAWRAAVALLLGAIAVAMAAWVVWRHAYLAKIGQFATVMGLLLVGYPTARLVSQHLRARSAAPRTALAQEWARPVPVRTGAAAHASPRRDIYVVILDAYANGAMLRERYRFDNRPFEDSLRALGFRIPTNVRSNYAHTIQSATSLLNFGHVTGLAADADTASWDWTLLAHLLDDNRAARFLKAQGYEVAFFPSTWWGPTQRSRHSDVQFRAFPRTNLRWELNRSDLRRALTDITPLRRLPEVVGRVAADAEHIRRTFAGLKQMPANRGPTFTFAHILAPHRPYVLDAECRTLAARTFFSPDEYGTPADRQAYVAQVRCINRQTLALVTALVTESESPPIIILQGDHGNAETTKGLISPDSTGRHPTSDETRVRFAAFGAYLLPGDGDHILPETVTPVNVLRYVFSHYFGADVAPAPDALYFSHLSRPYVFFGVDGRYQITRQPLSAAAVAASVAEGGTGTVAAGSPLGGER